MKHFVRLFALGLFFVIPILLIIVLGEKFIHILTPIGKIISEKLDLNGIFGKASVLIVCLALIALFCILCGYLLQKGVFKKYSSSFEEKLFIYFPTIQILKYRMIKNSGNVINEFWQGVVVKDEDSFRVGFITDSSEKYITIYLPDAPKIDAGEVRYLKKEGLDYHVISMQDAMQALYKFGKGLNIEGYID